MVFPLLGTLAPSTKMAETIFGFDMGYKAGASLIGLLAAKSNIEYQSQSLTANMSLWREQNELRKTLQGLSLTTAKTQSKIASSALVDAYTKAGINATTGTAADTVRRVEDMVFANLMTGVFIGK